MGIHLSTFISRVLTPNGGINTSRHLDIRVVGRNCIVCREDVTLGHGGSKLRGGAVTVDGGTTFVGGNGVDTVSGEHGTEVSGGGDGGDNVLGSVLLASDGLVGADEQGGCHEGERGEGFHEHG